MFYLSYRSIHGLDRIFGSDRPSQDGSSGITSVKAMDAAEQAGKAVEVGSNFFLFFSSKSMAKMGH
jgi:hypothetical protein